MYPELFRIPGTDWPVNTYGFLIMMGFALATYIGVQRARKLGIPGDVVLDVSIIAMIFGLLGAKVNYLLQYPHDAGRSFRIFDFSDGGLHGAGALILGPIPFLIWHWRTRRQPRVELYSWQNGVLLVATLFLALIGTRAMHLFLHRQDYEWKIITDWQKGFVLYGGLIAAIPAGMIWTLMRGISVARMSDLAAPLIMLGVAFGRVGCFMNGCCWGAAWEGGFCAVSFPKDSNPYVDHLNKGLITTAAESSRPVIPTQLFETAATLALFFLLSWYDRKKKKHPGETMLLMGLGYAAWRFFIEFLRADERPPWLGSLSYSQTLSLFIFIGCGAFYYYLRTRPAPAVAPEHGSR